jgi:hypothetical protein
MARKEPTKVTQAEADSFNSDLRSQYELEKWWIEDCKERSTRYAELLKGSGRPLTDKGVRQFVLNMAERLAAHIENVVTTPKRGGFTRNTLVIKELLKTIEPFELAYLVLGEAVNTIISSDLGYMTIQKMATNLAEAVNQEFKYRAMLAIAPEMPKIIGSVLRNSQSSLAHRKRTFVAMFHKRTGKHVPSVFHDNDSRILAGNALVELLFTIPGMALIKSEHGYDDAGNYRPLLRASEELRKTFWKDFDLDFLARRTMPLGILTYKPGRRNFMSEMLVTYDPPPINMNRLKGKLDTSGAIYGGKDLGTTRVLEALTHLEQTPVVINKQMLNFVRANKETLREMGALVDAKLNVTPCPLPDGVEIEEVTDEQTRKNFYEWKEHTKAAHDKHWKARIQLLKQERQLQLAVKLSQFDSFYQRWVSDFRGRMYPVNTLLSFQSNSLGKSLLEFADKAEVIVGDNNNSGWTELLEYGLRLNPDLSKAPIELLAVSFSDKAFLDEWVTDTLAILNGDNPAIDARTILKHYGKKDFFPFVAFIIHLRDLLQHWGLSVKSGHPIRRDATCSSMQHMGALAGDKKVLVATNCSNDAANVQDLYSEIVPDMEALGYRRDFVKKFVMTAAYNSTDFRRKQDMKATFKEEGVVKTSDEIARMNEALKIVVKKGLGKVTTLQSLLMEAFKELVTSRKMHALSITPTEYVVDSEKWEFPTKQYRVHHFDAHIFIRYKNFDEEPTINIRDTRQSWVANIIHSLDACLLHLAVSCLHTLKDNPECGRVSLHTIHDCFVTRPGDAGTIMMCLEAAFQEMYKPNADSGMAEALHRLCEFWDLQERAPKLYSKFTKLKAVSVDMLTNMKYFFV